MARSTTDAFVHVYTVVEVYEVGQVVDATPLYRLVLLVARPDDFEVGTLRPDLRMTVHAGLRRRQPRRVRCLDGGVAVAAVNPVVADVVLVRELYGLLALDVLARVVGRAVDLGQNPERGGDDEEAAEDAHLGDGVGSAVENLHALPVCPVTLGTCPAG